MEYKFQKLKFPVLGRVRDHEKALWDVREVRTTKHGFDLLFGSRVIAGVENWTGHPRLIATRELVDFWEANRIKHDGTIFDLPAGRTTLKRVRNRLKFHQPNDQTEFFEEHIEDLKTLSSTEFAARHNVPAHVVSTARPKLIGRTARATDWWQTPETLAVLRSKMTLREIGEKLNVGTSHAHRLRKLVRKMAHLANAEVPKRTASVEFLQEHIDELKAFTIEQFAAAHNLPFSAVAKLSRKVIGRRGRPREWWRTPKNLAILLSDLTLREMGELLKIDSSHVCVLRKRARKLVQPESAQVDLAA